MGMSYDDFNIEQGFNELLQLKKSVKLKELLANR